MSTTNIEDAIVSTARSLGFTINSATMSTVAIDLSGSTLDGDMIAVPGKGTLAITDYLRDLRSRAPSGFSRLQQPEKPDAERTVSELRRKRPLDAAWHARRAIATGITRTHMDAIAASRASR